MKKGIKIFMIVFLVLIILAGIAFVVVGNYFFDFALSADSSKAMVLDNNQGSDAEENAEKTENQIEEENIEKNELNKWFGENKQDIYITSDDNLKLHAYEFVNTEETDIWTIVIHGYSSEGKLMANYTKKFYDMGYNVLTVDLRGAGESEGDYIGMGWPDRLDIKKWINEIVSKNENSKIILFGLSMGAATTMMTTGEELPSNVKVAIEDCGYTSVWDEFAGQLEKLFHLPTFPALNAAEFVTNIRAGFNFKEASSVEQVKKSKTPTLFIHGDEDTFVPFWMLDEVYNAASCKKEKLVIEGAEHAESSEVAPELYWSTVERFIAENL